MCVMEVVGMWGGIELENKYLHVALIVESASEKF